MIRRIMFHRRFTHRERTNKPNLPGASAFVQWLEKYKQTQLSPTPADFRSGWSETQTYKQSQIHGGSRQNATGLGWFGESNLNKQSQFDQAWRTSGGG